MDNAREPFNERERAGRYCRKGAFRTALTLVRAPTALTGFLLVAVGSSLSSGGLPAPAVVAGMSVFFLICFAQSFNDLVDQVLDEVGAPDRPLPAGLITPLGAKCVCAFAGASGLVLGLVEGMRGTAVAVGLLSVSIAYSKVLKGTVLVGNLVVATTAASPLLVGALFAGAFDLRVWWTYALVACFMFGFEVLKTARDIEADAALGLVTVSTAFGMPVAISISLISSAAMIPAMVGLSVQGDGSALLGVALLFGVGLPMLKVWRQLIPAEAAARREILKGLALWRRAWMGGSCAIIIWRITS